MSEDEAGEGKGGGGGEGLVSSRISYDKGQDSLNRLKLRVKARAAREGVTTRKGELRSREDSLKGLQTL